MSFRADERRISAILPVYNAGEELERTFSQLERLDWLDLEIILFDDCSSDDTWPRIEAFAARDARVVAIRSDKNVGPGEARNISLLRARGRYVWFADWDDEWDPSILRKLWECADASAADVALCRGIWRRDGRDSEFTDGFDRAITLAGAEAFNAVLLGHIRGYLWTKLFRRESLGDQPFPNLRTLEDLCAVAGVVSGSSRVAAIPDVLYTHVVRVGSLTNSPEPRLEDIEEAGAVVLSLLAARPLSADQAFAARYFALVYVHLAGAGTAMRLSSRAIAAAALRRTRSQLELRFLLKVLPHSPKLALIGIGIWSLGPRYLYVRNSGVKIRALWGRLRQS